MSFLIFIYASLITILLFFSIFRLNKYRKLYHNAKSYKPNHPIPIISLENVDPVFQTQKHGVHIDATIKFVPAGDKTIGTTSDFEAWILAALSINAKNMFEFGTASGRTTYLWAKNSSEHAKIATITLHPEQQLQYQKSTDDDTDATQSAINESIYSDFIYTGDPTESKIIQLFGDSKAFDEKPFLKTCDLIFIDGSHSHSYIKSDTEKAMTMLKPGGIIVWHDYRNDTKHTLGVYQYLNELANRLKLFWIPKTSLVIYRT